MIKRLFGTLACFCALTGCAHKSPANSDQVPPVTAQMAKSDPVFTADAATGKSCSGDADCGAGELCNPEGDRCMSSYPNPRMLDMSFLSKMTKDECKLVNLYFPYDSTELVPEAQRWLQYNVHCIKAIAPKELVVKGHADSRGSAPYNQKLSLERGEVIRGLLTQAGLNVPITVKGAGESMPLKTGKTEKDFAFNRRVELSAQ